MDHVAVVAVDFNDGGVRMEATSREATTVMDHFTHRLGDAVLFANLKWNGGD